MEVNNMRFPVVLHTDDGIRYGVTVPDLPGCFSAGDTFDSALDSAVEAIELHLEGMSEDGEALPVPRPVSEHRTNPDFDGGVWAAVWVDDSRFDGRAERINITVPKNLLARIDEYARTHGATRSGFMADAARVAMGR
jgi:predicted RNase H-like HicB family nuclease